MCSMFSGKTLERTKVDPGLHEASSASVFMAQLSDAVNGLAGRQSVVLCPGSKLGINFGSQLNKNLGFPLYRDSTPLNAEHLHCTEYIDISDDQRFKKTACNLVNC
jgi:hypothetical protein